MKIKQKIKKNKWNIYHDNDISKKSICLRQQQKKMFIWKENIKQTI